MLPTIAGTARTGGGTPWMKPRRVAGRCRDGHGGCGLIGVRITAERLLGSREASSRSGSGGTIGIRSRILSSSPILSGRPRVARLPVRGMVGRRSGVGPCVVERGVYHRERRRVPSSLAPVNGGFDACSGVSKSCTTQSLGIVYFPGGERNSPCCKTVCTRS